MLARPFNRAGATVVAALLLLTPAVGHAQDDDPSPLDAQLRVTKKIASASFDVTSALTEAFRKRLLNGLSSRVVIETRLVDDKGRAIARTARRCRFQFDIWDEILEVRIREGDHTRAVIQRRRIDHGLDDCGRVANIPLLDAELLRGESSYHLEVLVQLNPVTEEQIQRAREFMSNPSRRGTRRRSFFSAVAKFFGIGTERSSFGDAFLFRSQKMRKPMEKSKP